MNRLYYGDNLDVLRRHVEDASVDRVYLDPPFNSNVSYNVLFAERNGMRAASQIKAFEDTWQWGEAAARACAEIIEPGGKVSEVMQAFRTFLGDSNMMASVQRSMLNTMSRSRARPPRRATFCSPRAS